MNLLSMREAVSQLGFAPKTMRKLIRASGLRGESDIPPKWFSFVTLSHKKFSQPSCFFSALGAGLPFVDHVNDLRRDRLILPCRSA
jgi:hypothetical protein